MKIDIIKVTYLQATKQAYISFKIAYLSGNLLSGQLKVNKVNTKPGIKICKGIVLSYLNLND